MQASALNYLLITGMIVLLCGCTTTPSRDTPLEVSRDFGLEGKIVILDARYLIDGGSVTLLLRDEHENLASVRYTNDWLYDAKQHGGQFSIQDLKHNTSGPDRYIRQ